MSTKTQRNLFIIFSIMLIVVIIWQFGINGGTKRKLDEALQRQSEINTLIRESIGGEGETITILENYIAGEERRSEREREFNERERIIAKGIEDLNRREREFDIRERERTIVIEKIINKLENIESETKNSIEEIRGTNNKLKRIIGD